MATFADQVRQRRTALVGGTPVPTGASPPGVPVPEWNPADEVAATGESYSELVRRRRLALSSGPQTPPEDQELIDEQSVMASFEKLGQDTPLERDDWRNIARAVIQFKTTPDLPEETVQLADQIMQAYGPQLRPHIEVAAGEDWWDKNYVEPPEIGGWKGVLKDVMDVPGVTGLLEFLDRPSQAMLHTIRGVVAAVDPNDNIDAGDALRYAGSSFGNMLNVGEDWGSRRMEITTGPMEGATITFDRDGDGSLNFREAADVDPEAGGLWLGAVDLAATIITDPTTWAGIGPAARALRGLQILETAGGNQGRAIVNMIRRNGWKALDDEAREFAERTIREQMNEGARRIIAIRNLPDAERRRALRTIGRSDDALRRAAERRAERTISSVQRGGQRGLRLAGNTVPLTPYVADVLERARILTPERWRKVTVADNAANVVEEVADVDPTEVLQVVWDDYAEGVGLGSIPTPEQLADMMRDRTPEFLQPNVLTYEDVELLFPDAAPVQLQAAFPEIADEPLDLLPPTSATPDIPLGEGRREAAQAALRRQAALRGSAARRAGEFVGDPVPESQVADLVDRPWTPPANKNRTGGWRLSPQERQRVKAVVPDADRTLSRSEKLMILELQDRGATPFYDAATGTVKVRTDAGYTYVLAKNTDEPLLGNHSVFLTREGDSSRLPAVIDQTQLPPRYTLPQGQAEQLSFADEAVDAAPVRRTADPITDAVQGELPFEGTIPGTAFDPDNWVPQQALDELVDPYTALFRQAGPDVQRLVDPDAIAEDIGSAVAAKIPRSEWVMELSDPGLIARILDTKVVMALRHALVPRARLRSALTGLSHADVAQFERTVAGRIARQERESVDALLRLEGKLSRKAVREAGGRENLLRTLNAALANPAEWEAVYSAAGPRVRDLLDTVRQIRQETLDATLRGGADPAKLAPIAEAYIPRVFSARARRQLNDILRRGGAPAARIREAFRSEGIEIGERIGRDALDTTQSGFLLKRGFQADVNDLYELNEMAAAWLRDAAGVEINDLFETDVLRAFAIRHRAAMEAAMRTDLASALADITTADGFRAGYVIPAGQGADELSAAAYLRSQGVSPGKYELYLANPDGTQYWVRTEMVDDMKHSARFLQDQQNLSRFRRFIDDWNGLWASYATVPLIGLGFHARNATGNIFNMMLAGFNDPRAFADAFRIQKAGAAIRDQMGSTGQDFLTAARALGYDDDVIDLITQARDWGVYSGGKVGDIFSEAKRGETVSTLDRFNPISQRNLVISSGRGIGEAIENNARLALFIDGIRKGMSPEDAAARVRKYLFDYADLTSFERDTLRMLSRFYTFMRKNTALQFATLAMYPGRVLNAQRITDFFVEEFFPPAADAENYLLPEWAQELRDTTIRTIPGGGDQRLLVNVDTPLVGAFRTVNQLGSLAATIPGLDRVLPPILAAGDRQAKFGNAVSLFSGGPATAVNYLMGGNFGRDPFSLARLDGDGTSEWVRFANIFAPVVGKVYREGEKIGAWGDDQGDASVRVMNALFGLYTMQLTETGQDRARNAIISELGDAIRSLRDSGVEVPTFDELQQAGLVELQSRAIEALVYGDNPDEVAEALLGMVGADVIEATGLVRSTPLSISDELSDEEILRRARDWEFALRYSFEDQGLPPPTEEEMANILLLTPWAPADADTEEGLIQPGRTPSDNRFRLGAGRESWSTPQVEERLNLIGRVVGLDADKIRSYRPLLTEAQQILQEGYEAGLSPQEIQSYLVERMSRTERGIVFGTDSLERFYDGSYTEEDLRKARNTAWERASELTVVMQMAFGRQPTQEELAMYAFWNELSIDEQERVGLPRRPKIPSREDIRTEGQRTTDARSMVSSVLTGLTQGPELLDE